MLEIQNISKSYQKKIALDDVSISVKEGEIFGLLGPNGAGKTTLIRIINQIIQQDKGVIRFKGNLISQKDLASIGYLPEERGLYKTMTVENQILFLGQLRGFSKADVKSKMNYWLEKFEISDWKKKRIEELSKGMAQKIQFICTVLHEPDLLILDEPYSGFDPMNVELIKQELVEMRAKGKTVILSTHNMDSVEQICDRVALIHQAKKIIEGRVGDLQEERKSGIYEVKFRGNMIAFVNALWTGFEIVDKTILSDDLFKVQVKARGDNSFEDLLRVLIGQVKIEAANEMVPSMNSIFIESVNKKVESHEE